MHVRFLSTRDRNDKKSALSFASFGARNAHALDIIFLETNDKKLTRMHQERPSEQQPSVVHSTATGRESRLLGYSRTGPFCPEFGDNLSLRL